MGCAWAALTCYFVIMILSYYFGQKHMPIKYDLKTIGLYSVVAIVLYMASTYIDTAHKSLNIALKSLLMIGYLTLLVKRDFPLNTIPVINKFFTNNNNPETQL
jgi:membrane-associated HD superfamily phosphohydrolase